MVCGERGMQFSELAKPDIYMMQYYALPQRKISGASDVM